MRKNRLLRPLEPGGVTLTGGALRRMQERNRKVTAPKVLAMCEDTGRVEALKHAWDGNAETRPHPFWDSDIGKSIESVAYALRLRPDPALEARVDAIVELLAAAQEPDGYLNTYYQTCEPPENRWTNLYYMHELYCMGHLIEGAVAYRQVTGKDRFLRIMCRYADLACDLFGEGGRLEGGYGGHPEAELALVRLYEATGEERYLDLSRKLIHNRGRQPYYFETESLRRGVDTEKAANLKRHLKRYLPSRGPYAEYQANVPVAEQTEPVGHAVRAMYLLAGAADVADYEDDPALRAATLRVWRTMCETQYAITGGIGPSADGERFTYAYDLPNEYTYNETCASVALMMAGRKLLERTADAAVADVLEQTLYNTVMASVSADGERFFYANYLAVTPERFEHASKAVIDKMRAERQPWFDVACCPPNVSRLMGSIPDYMASQGDGALYVHLYGSCDIRAEGAEVRVRTEYPWSGEIAVSVAAAREPFALCLRIPGWCGRWRCLRNGSDVPPETVNGYLRLPGCHGGDEITLSLAMEARAMQADPRVREDCGKIAWMRGPVVYCLEQADNGANLSDVAVSPRAEAEEATGLLPFAPDAVCLRLPGWRLHAEAWTDGALYRPATADARPVAVTAVPYALWGNRGFGEMQVWLNRKDA